MQIRIFVFLFITFNTFSNFVSGQLKPQAPPTQSHLDADALREYYKHSKPTPPISTYTPPKNNTNYPSGSSTILNNKEFLPSAEAQKAIDDAINKYDEKIKMASACVCNTLPYTEVKFIYSTPVYQKKYGLNEKSQELFDMANQLNNVELLSGYLLNIKGEGKQVVAVESQSKYDNGMVWRAYLVQWDKYNKGNLWSDSLWNINISSGLGYNATLTDKLKNFEKKIKEKLQPLAAASFYTRVKFQNLNFTKADYGYKLNINVKDSIFLVNEQDKNYIFGDVYLIDLSKKSTNTQGTLFLTYNSLEPAPLEQYNPTSPIKITALGFAKLERLVNEKIGKITPAENQRLKKIEDDAIKKITAQNAEWANANAQYYKEKNTTALKQSASIRSAAAYSPVKLGLDYNSTTGYKLKYRNSDSFFIVAKNYYSSDTSANQYTIFVVDLKKPDATIDPVYYAFFSYGTYSKPGGSKVFTEEDKKLLPKIEEDLKETISKRKAAIVFDEIAKEIGFNHRQYYFKKYTEGPKNQYQRYELRQKIYYGYVFNEKEGIGVLEDDMGNFFYGDCNPEPQSGVRFNADGSKTIFRVQTYGYYKNDNSRNFVRGVLDKYGLITISKEGDIYFGAEGDTYFNTEFINGKRQGRGKLITYGGDFYYGSFSDGKFSDRGELYYANGDIYAGKFSESLYNGTGVLYTAKGRYQGGFVNGTENGEAVLSLPDNPGRYTSEYYTSGQREIKKSKKLDPSYKPLSPEGLDYYGYYSHFSTSAYTTIADFLGDFSSTSIQKGYGRIKYVDGSVYTGRITFKQLHYGVLTLNDGTKLIGDHYGTDFSNISVLPNYFNEKWPVVMSPNNDVFFGPVNSQFKKDGFGILRYGNGDVYIGIVKSNFRHTAGYGHSLMIFQNGDIYRGAFANDKMEGKGEYIDWVKQEKFCGSFKNGLREGKGILCPLNGEPKIVEYKNGVLQQ